MSALRTRPSRIFPKEASREREAHRSSAAQRPSTPARRPSCVNLLPIAEGANETECVHEYFMK